MKKQKQKLLVLRELSRGDIESIGINKLANKTWWILLILLVGCFIWTSAIVDGDGQINLNENIPLIIMVVGVITYYGYLWYFGGRKLWNKVKYKEQPIKID